MAMNKQDYQYVSNSFDRLKNRVDDGELKIGSTVKNLAIELSQETVYNPDYIEYYGEKTLDKVWSSESSTVFYSEDITLNNNNADISYKDKTDDVSISQEVGGIAIYKNNRYSHTGFVLAEGEVYAESIKINLDPNIIAFATTNFDKVTKKIHYTITTNSKTYVGGVISYETKKTKRLYTIKYKYPLIPGATLYSVTSTTLGVQNPTWTPGSNLITFIEIERKLVSINVKWFTTNNNGLVRKTIQDGLLKHQVSLKSNTSYVIQIIDSLKSKGSDWTNKIYDKDNKTFEKTFNQYLFFETPEMGSKNVNFILDINGLSYGYKIFGKFTDPTDGKTTFCELRSIETNKQAKVFLFESNSPWVVDKNGVIVSLMDSALESPKTSSEKGSNAFLTEDEIKNIFSNPPILNCDEKTLSIIPPGGFLKEQETWKYKELWEWTRNKNENKPSIMDNLYLFVYRNFLTQEERTHGKIKRKVQYGKLNNIQRTIINPKDPYCIVTNANANSEKEKELKDISFSEIELDFTKSNSSSYPSFKITSDSEEIITGRDSDGKNLKTTPSLAKFSLAGHNYSHGLTKTNKYKYTSISFAWGYIDDYGNCHRLSDYSIPVIIYRGSVNFMRPASYVAYKIVFKENLYLHKETSTDYYSGEAIYLDEKTSI